MTRENVLNSIAVCLELFQRKEFKQRGEDEGRSELSLRNSSPNDAHPDRTSVGLPVLEVAQTVQVCETCVAPPGGKLCS